MNTIVPRVSVICIFYNAQRFIVEAIQSVLAQEFLEFELLLVDDGSGDASSAIAQSYAERFADRVRYLHHEGHVNRGMSATRNLGLANARGELIAFIDSDDSWRPQKLREQVALLDEHPEVGLLAGAANYWRSWNGQEDRVIQTGHVQDRIVHPPQATLLVYPLGRANAPTPSDLMVRRHLVERLGGFEAHFNGPRQMYEDQGFLAKIYLDCPVYFSTKTWLDYRQHEDSCVATVTRAGGYWQVRAYFLAWFARYVRGTAYGAHPQVRRALSRARLEARLPTLFTAVARFGASVERLARRAPWGR